MRSTMESGVRAFALAAATAAALATPASGQYLDPGAGSMIVQLVIALAIGVMATAKLYWRRLTALVTRRTKSDSES